MAGGVGSRFWPASRESLPKQFLDILGVGKSLIQLTYDRALQLVPKENILIATNKRYKGLVNEHLPDISDNQILKIKTTDKSAHKDFKSFCDKTGHQLVEYFKETNVTIFYIKKLTL